jgi:hypothetical protein
MAGASARKVPHRPTMQLDLHVTPMHESSAAHEELPPLVASVARMRIVPVGKTSAARSGGTIRIGGTVVPLHNPDQHDVHAWQPQPQEPRVQQQPSQRRQRVECHRPARVVRETPPNAVDALAGEEAMAHQVDMMRMRAANMLSGLQGGMATRRMALGNWARPSTRALCIAVAAYALCLFLFAVFSG